jgi:hypothetical protein
VDAIAGHTDSMSELILVHADRSQKCFLQNFAWVRITQRRHDDFLFPARPLVIVHDFNIPCIAIDPSKANAPLIIYPKAHLTATLCEDRKKRGLSKQTHFSGCER